MSIAYVENIDFVAAFVILMQFQPQRVLVAYLPINTTEAQYTRLGASFKAGRYLSLREAPIKRAVGALQLFMQLLGRPKTIS